MIILPRGLNSWIQYFEGRTSAPAPSPVPAPSPAPVPTRSPSQVTDSMPPLQQGQINCPCPQRTCITTITSTNNMHTITCGSNTHDVTCGGPLMVTFSNLLMEANSIYSGI